MQGKIAAPRHLRNIALALTRGKTYTQLGYQYGISRVVISKFKAALKTAGYLNENVIKELTDDEIVKVFYPQGSIVIKENGETSVVINRTGDNNYLPVDTDFYVQKILDEHITTEEAYHQYCDKCNQENLKEFSRANFFMKIKARSADYTRGQDAIMTLRYEYSDIVQIDYIGQKVTLTMEDGHKQDFVVCVLVWPASYYTFAIFIPNQSTEQTCFAVGEAYKFFNCLSQKIVPDNAKSMVLSHPIGREAIINPTFENYMNMMGIYVMPANVYKPTEKSAVEYENRLIKERVYPHIDKTTPKTLYQHNTDFIALINKYINQTVLRNCGKTRTQLFELYERPKARKLKGGVPEYEEVILAQRVPKTYHLKVNEHQYSVPFSCIGLLVDIHISATTVKFYHQRSLIAIFPRVDGEGITTNEQHMPAHHKAVANPQYDFKDEKTLLGFAREISETLYGN